MADESASEDNEPSEIVELVAVGPRETIRGFVSGYLAGENLPDDAVLYAEECGVAVESLAERLAEFVHLRDNHEFLLLDERLADELEATIKEIGKPLQLTVRGRRSIEAASFRFSFDAYNRPLGSKLQQLVAELSVHLELSDDYKTEVHQSDEATGAELYSPVHDVAIHAEGGFKGPLRQVLAARQRFEAEEMAAVEPLVLHYRE